MDNYQKLFGDKRKLALTRKEEAFRFEELNAVLSKIPKTIKEEWFLAGLVAIDAYKNQKFERAMEFVNKTLELNPTHSMFFMLRGNIKEDTNDIKGAIEDFKKSIEFRDWYTDYFQIGMSFQRANNFNKAVIAYDISIELKEKIPIETNVPFFSNGIISKVNFETIYNNRALSKANLNKLNEAIEDFTTAISFNENYGNAYFGRGSCKERKGDKEGSIKDLYISASLGFQPAINIIQNS